MIRLGLCCKFNRVPIKFRTTTARFLKTLTRPEQLLKLDSLIRDNIEALQKAILFNAANGIGGFRVNSQILPMRTHPEVGYDMAELPNDQALIQALRDVGERARHHDIRLSFHPDQFVVLNAENPAIVTSSVQELNYQAEVAEWIGADVINVHAGGGYGDKASALKRLERVIDSLQPGVRRRLTLENDEHTYSPFELFPLCLRSGIPLVYDVHHHRCNPDGRSIEEATDAALSTWDREPLFHVSSPRDGWDKPQPKRHHEYINLADLPTAWLAQELTIDLEAKAKEDAVLRLRDQLLKNAVLLRPTRHPG